MGVEACEKQGAKVFRCENESRESKSRVGWRVLNARRDPESITLALQSGRACRHARLQSHLRGVSRLQC